jgi:phage tail sheath gpL-like
MGVTAELENLGDTRLSKEIAANIEHALSDRQGNWRVTIAGSRASDNWEMRVEGPNGFERTYTLTSSAGEHEPEAIRRLITQMVPRSSA